MTNKPAVKHFDWIEFGVGESLTSAVVCKVYEDTSTADIEIVYLDWKRQPVNEDMVWKDGNWCFVKQGPSGGYADKSDRLSPYVAQLLRGR